MCEGVCCLEELLVFEHLQMRQVRMSRCRSPLAKNTYKHKHRGPGGLSVRAVCQPSFHRQPGTSPGKLASPFRSQA